MFYRIVALSLVGLGFVSILSNFSWPIELSPSSLEKSGLGLSTIFIGLLNLAYIYGRTKADMPRIVLLGANLLFIGYSILLITSDIAPIYGYIALPLSLMNCIMVLNHKV